MRIKAISKRHKIKQALHARAHLSSLQSSQDKERARAIRLAKAVLAGKPIAGL